MNFIYSTVGGCVLNAYLRYEDKNKNCIVIFGKKIYLVLTMYFKLKKRYVMYGVGTINFLISKTLQKNISSEYVRGPFKFVRFKPT